MLRHQRLHREPIHQRKIVILRVLVVSQQTLHQCGPQFFARGALRSGGDEETHELRRIALRHRVEIRVGIDPLLFNLAHQSPGNLAALERELNRPRANPLVAALGVLDRRARIESRCGMQRPQRAKLRRRVSTGRQLLLQRLGRCGLNAGRRRAFLQYPPRMTAQELVLRRHELHQLLIAQLPDVHARRLLLVVNDFVNASVAAVVAVLAVVMALVLVVPIDDEHAAVLIVELVERLRPGVVEV